MKTFPLYQVIMQALEERIKQGVYSGDEAVPSESELEKEFNVSNITARRALNELANKGLIYRVKGGGSFVKIISEQDDAALSAHQKMISLLLPFDSSAGRGIDIICGASDYLFDKGYYLNVVNCHDNFAEERNALDKLAKISSGIIFYPRTERSNMDLLCLLTANNYPLVTVDKVLSCDSQFSVTADNIGGAYALTKHILDAGHREICFVSNAPIEYASTIRDRFMGFCKAMMDKGIEVTSANYLAGFGSFFEKMKIPFNGTQEQQDVLFEEIISTMLDRPNPVTAIWALNDNMAHSIFKALQLRGVKVPQDVSLVGFDNLPFGEYLNPALTTVGQDFYSMGREAAEMVVARYEKQDIQKKNVVLPTHLIVRESVAIL